MICTNDRPGDVNTQSTAPGWTLGKWADYYETEASARDKIRNVISLEISGTDLADKVLPPRIVRELDWVEKFWPSTKKGRGNAYPKVQLYCLMGVAGAWTVRHRSLARSALLKELRCRIGTSISLARLCITIFCTARKCDHSHLASRCLFDASYATGVLLHPSDACEPTGVRTMVRNGDAKPFLAGRYGRRGVQS